MLNFSYPGNDLEIQSIVVSKEDDHLFLPDLSNCSIIKLKESGELVCDLILKEKGENFHPTGMFFNSSEILRVNCGEWGGGTEKKLIFFERQKFYF